jgi:hypothetical protein
MCKEADRAKAVIAKVEQILWSAEERRALAVRAKVAFILGG